MAEDWESHTGDVNGDGVEDTVAYADTDGDGARDTFEHDWNEDGEIDSVETAA